MILVVILYALLASAFTFGKAALLYVHPIFLIGVRMSVGGALLLGYLTYIGKRTPIARADVWLFAQAVLIHIYGSYVLEFWALQFMTSSKACLLYSLMPFITALLCAVLFSEHITFKQFIGLCIGTAGFIPILVSTAPLEELVGGISIISWPEIVMTIAVCCAAYGWLVVRQLTIKQHYSPIFVNGVGMLGGGLLALATSFLLEGMPSVAPASAVSVYGASGYLTTVFGDHGAGMLLFAWYTLMLVIVVSIVGYNLYGFLLRRYSVTFLAFAGVMTPLFAALFGWLLLGEMITWHFFASLAIISLGLYIFYQDELKLAIR